MRENLGEFKNSGHQHSDDISEDLRNPFHTPAEMIEPLSKPPEGIPKPAIQPQFESRDIDGHEFLIRRN